MNRATVDPTKLIVTTIGDIALGWNYAGTWTVEVNASAVVITPLLVMPAVLGRPDLKNGDVVATVTNGAVTDLVSPKYLSEFAAVPELFIEIARAALGQVDPAPPMTIEQIGNELRIINDPNTPVLMENGLVPNLLTSYSVLAENFAITNVVSPATVFTPEGNRSDIKVGTGSLTTTDSLANALETALFEVFESSKGGTFTVSPDSTLFVVDNPTQASGKIVTGVLAVNGTAILQTRDI